MAEVEARLGITRSTSSSGRANDPAAGVTQGGAAGREGGDEQSGAGNDRRAGGGGDDPGSEEQARAAPPLQYYPREVDTGSSSGSSGAETTMEQLAASLSYGTLGGPDSSMMPGGKKDTVEAPQGTPFRRRLRSDSGPFGGPFAEGV